MKEKEENNGGVDNEEDKKIENGKTNETASEVRESSTVTVVYTGTLDDGSVFDKVEDKEKPFKFKVGSKQVIKRFEESIVGMKKGEKKKIHIKSEDAYGQRNDALLLKVPKNFLESKVKVEPGKHIMFTAPDGSSAYAIIKEIEGDDVVLDLNHPLAGKNLNFDIEVIDIQN